MIRRRRQTPQACRAKPCLDALERAQERVLKPDKFSRGVSDTPRRRPGGRQGHAHEVRRAEGPSRRSPASADRSRARNGPARSAQRPSRGGRPRRGPVERHLQSQRRRQFVAQEPQLGTGHALLQTEPVLRGHKGTVILLSGDVPLLTSETLHGLLDTHREANAAATVLTATLERPYGYGRIVPSHGRLTRIVEERDATTAQREIREINSGIYALALEPPLRGAGRHRLRKHAGRVLPSRSHWHLSPQETRVTTFTITNAVEIRGINSRTELAEVSSMVRQQKNEELMAAGVTIVDPATTYIDSDVEIGAGHGHSPVRLPRARHQDWRGLRDPLGRARGQLDDRRSRASFATTPSSPTRPSPPARRSARLRTCGRAPTLAKMHTSATSSSSRRRPWARAAKPTIWRIWATPRSAPRSTSAPERSPATMMGSKKHHDRHRGRRLHRQQLHARRARHRRARRVCRRRFGRDQRCPGRRARNRARAAGK